MTPVLIGLGPSFGGLEHCCSESRILEITTFHQHGFPERRISSPIFLG